MPNKAFSDLKTVGYKGSILVVAVDPSLPVVDQNVNLLASSFPAGTGGGASTISDLTDAADLTGTAYSFVGFDASAAPAVIISPVANTFIGYDASGIAIARNKAQMITALGLGKAVLTQNIATVTNGKLTFVQRAPASFTVVSLDASVVTGSFTVSVAVNGTAVSGLSSVLVNSPTNALTLSSGGATAAEDSVITATISGATGSPTGAVLSLNLLRN